MRGTQFKNFASAISFLTSCMKSSSKKVHSRRWQGSEIADKPEMATHELQQVCFGVDLGHEDAEKYAADIKPNMPWAEDHFQERVCGYPINPGLEWKNWPYGKSAERFLDERGMFNHNYMERYWPKFAGHIQAPSYRPEELELDFGAHKNTMLDDWSPHKGIMYEYGDLNDVVELLVDDPYTRQAYLPVWFPEDTGGGSKRAPCTLGYHFMMRDGRLDIFYPIRSCDFVRHFRDDLYLTVRLLLWVLEECRKKDERWNEVKPGRFVMHINSLHVFANDYIILRGDNRG